MFGIGWQELLIILIIVVLLFGAKNIPEITRSIAEGIQAFKKEFEETEKI